MSQDSGNTEESVLTLAFITKGEEIGVVLTLSVHHSRPCHRHPGGGVEEGETKEQAAVRELLDETGLRAKSIFEVPELLTEKPSRNGSIKPHQQYVFIALIDSLDGYLETAVDGEDLLKNKIYPIDEVKSAAFCETRLDGYNILVPHRDLFKKVYLSYFTTSI